MVGYGFTEVGEGGRYFLDALSSHRRNDYDYPGANYEINQELSLAQRRAYMALPLAERRKRLAAQAEQMAAHYEHASEQIERLIWRCIHESSDPDPPGDHECRSARAVWRGGALDADSAIKERGTPSGHTLGGSYGRFHVPSAVTLFITTRYGYTGTHTRCYVQAYRCGRGVS